MTDGAERCVMGGKKSKNVWWNDVGKFAWKEILSAMDEVAKERCMAVYKEEKRKLKSV